MDIPILSIDYSLAPEAPFPRAFEDIFYTYCWILKNVELLGSTGENIVFAGDSAGGNLNTACIVKCIEMGVPLPKGLFNAYTPFLVNFASTPARFLSLVDPLLPYGFIMRVFKSYGAVKLDSNALPIVNIGKHEDHDLVEDVHDDDQDISDLPSPASSKVLETMWNKIQNNAEESEWQTNLGSIRETPSEEPTSPFNFNQTNDDDDEDALEMKISTRVAQPEKKVER
jgi:hormone-sensitive lipase